MARSREELMQMNELDPLLAEAVRQRPVQVHRDDFLSARKARADHLSVLRKFMNIPGAIPEVNEEDRFIPTQDGNEIRIRIYRPISPEPESSPLIVMFHEGGFSMGDLTDEEMNCRMFSRDLNAICVNVEYRLAPEHPFPTGVLDAWDALQWAARNSKSLSANPRRGFIVGGSSAGGNISAVLAHLALTESLDPPLTGQYLSVPFLIPSPLLPERYRSECLSETENDHDPVLTGKFEDLSKALEETYKPDLSSPLYSPFAPSIYPPSSTIQSAPSGGLAPLAKAYFQVAGMDPLRDHAFIYDRVLREEFKVDTRVDVYPGHSHMFWTNWPELQRSKVFVADTVKGVKWLLDG